jgi:hypothetical protein
MDEHTDFNPKRRLCPDGTCTGFLGANGRCTECGRAGDGAAEDAPPGVFAVLDAEDDLPDAAPAATASASHEKAGPGISGFDPNRRLCDDGTCVGVIGPDGACLICRRIQAG